MINRTIEIKRHYNGVTGRVALVYDTSAHQFWIYDSGWKQPKTPAAAAIVTWQ